MQLEFNEVSRPITAIRTHCRLHQFKQMPFWLAKQTPCIPMSYARNTISLLMDIHSCVHQQYSGPLKNLRGSLKTRWYCTPSHCRFRVNLIPSQVSHWIPKHRSPGQYSFSTWVIHQEKLKAMWELEALTDKKKLEMFLGLAVYFSAYIPYFSWMANLLFKTLRKKEMPFVWNTTHQKCLELIKLALVSAPVWGHPEPGQPYRLYTNAWTML